MSKLTLKYSKKKKDFTVKYPESKKDAALVLSQIVEPMIKFGISEFSFLDELDKRGYDLETLKFSIKKKRQ